MRLSTAALGAPPLALPYDRAAVRRGVVHLGIGAFHRAHQAAVFDAALAAGDLRWGITGVSLRSGEVRDRLAPQDGLYGLVVRDGADTRVRLLGAVADVLVTPEDPARVVAAIAAPDTAMVTLTVTEKGYMLDAAGLLRLDDPDVAHDLAHPAAPRTAIGLLTAGLASRHAAGLGGLTVVSCDNLSRNGARLGAAVMAMADAHDPALARWIEAEAAFPATMVDRIVPAPTAADGEAVAARFGVEDQAAVGTEPFTQWVIQDRFAGPRPDFAALGVQLTADVVPWEAAKLRLLNGAHSAMAYLGGLDGVERVDGVVATAAGRRLVERLWEENAATLAPPPELDLLAYRTALMARFANPALGHRLRQIAMDGSQKLPPRIMIPLAERLSRGQASPMLALTFAAWIRWQAGVDDKGVGFTVDDPLADRLAAALKGAATAAERVSAVLGMEALVPPALAATPGLHAAVTEPLARLERAGARAAIDHVLQAPEPPTP